MKNSVLTLLVLTLFLSCGKDGKDGRAFLSFTWDYYVDSYTDNNPDVPYGISEYEEYRTDPGRFSYDFYCSDGYGNYWGYEGTYTIEINRGSDGGFITDGEDGDDNHYRMNLTGDGPSLYLNKKQGKKLMLFKRPEIDLSLYRKIRIGEPTKETFYSESGQMVVTKQMFQLKKL